MIIRLQSKSVSLKAEMERITYHMDNFAILSILI